MAIILLEQCDDFTRALADRIAVMVRGAVALEGAPGALDEAALRRMLTV